MNLHAPAPMPSNDTPRTGVNDFPPPPLAPFRYLLCTDALVLRVAWAHIDAPHMKLCDGLVGKAMCLNAL